MLQNYYIYIPLLLIFQRFLKMLFLRETLEKNILFQMIIIKEIKKMELKKELVFQESVSRNFKVHI